MKKNSFLTSLLAAAVLATANIVIAADRTIVKDGETINIQDKTYNNIQYEGEGGAVYVESESKGKIDSINSSTFDGNTAQSGGAIATDAWIGSEFSSSPIIGAINDSIFTNNTATGVYFKDDLSDWPEEFEKPKAYETLSGSGGAINSFFVINEINNTIFSNNRVDITSLTTENSQYDLLQVSASGGAVSGRIANINNATFTNNYVKSNGVSGGGALALADNYIRHFVFNEDRGFENTELTKLPAFNIKDSTFENNRAEGLYAAGGAVTANGEVNITNTKFNSNTAENAGGAMYLPGITKQIYNTGENGEMQLVKTIYTDAVIKDSTFENNSVTNNKASDIYSNYYIDSFGEETAEEYYKTTPQGGAIYSGGNLSIDNTVFKGNSAIKVVETNSSNENGTINSLDQEGKGGAIYNTGEASEEISYYPDLSVRNSTFENNKSTEGGAIYNEGTIKEFKGNTFTDNSALYEYKSERSHSYVDNGITVSSNSSQKSHSGSGGAIYSKNGDLNIENNTFERNTAAYGGAIFNETGAGSLNIKDSKFINNSSYNEDFDSGTLTVGDKTYTWKNEHYGLGSGGAIVSYSDTTIENSEFDGNTTGGDGGAMYIHGNLTVKNSSFKNNIAKANNKGTNYNYKGNGEVEQVDYDYDEGYGGAISHDGENLIIENSRFEGNIAGGEGGGAINAGSTLATISNSTFTSNSTTGSGGAIDFGYGGTLNITDTDFINNSAKQGGAINAENTNSMAPVPAVTITALNKDIEFSGNSADKGGDIYISDGILNLNANTGRQMKFDGGIVGRNSIININDSSVNSLYENLSSVGKIVIDNFVTPEETSSLSVNLKAGTLALTKDNYLNGTDLTLEEGSLLDLANNNVGEMNLNSLTSNNANLKIDMNLASSSQIFDTIKANTATGVLNLQNVNIISDFTDTTKNEYTASITSDGMELKTPENGINVLTNDYVYTIAAKDKNLTVNRLADENGEALKTDGFTVAVNQTDKVGGVDVSLSDDRIYSANSDIKITATNSETGWTGSLGGKSLTVNGNGYTLDGEDNVGFAVNNGQTLTFNDTNIKGFVPIPERKAALTINDGGTVNINASNSDVSIGNNSNTDVIYLDGTSSKAFLTTENNKSITVNDKISSANSSNELNLNGNGKITFAGIAQKLTLNNENTNTIHNTYVDGVNYNLNSGMVTFAKDEYLNGQGNKNTLNFNGGTLNLANNSVGTIDLAGLNLNFSSNIMLDADLARATMDRLTADRISAAENAFLNVNHINLLSDAETDSVQINMVDPVITLESGDTLASHIATSVTEVAYSPIYKYGVGYDPTTGNFSFTRGSSQNYNNVNPSVMVGPVAAQLGGYMGMLDTYNNAFNNMDMRMLNPASVRVAQKQANRYAITEEADGVTYKVNETNSGGTWVRPFAAYDSVGLKNGPKVDNFSYGTFIGGDSAIHQFKNGGEGVLSAHVSYLGSHQSFNGNSIYQNGGNLGLTGTYYKGNFFTGLTVNAGASVADASTFYGNEDFPMFMAGIANKTGYNFEFKDGKFIIQPSLLLSYTFVNTFNYTNAAGISINGDPLHALQISPNVRFAFNTQNGWQPYLTAGMNWNIMNDSEFTANMATLPDLSIKPYVQYGLGIQKTINDNFTAYGQVLIRNGGRNGIAANAGLRYIFGHESKPNENI